ncbi:lipase 3-like [Galleria mellonella]|uniref:Lipase 3-like n=1 Tax=Galleria mellonella TaxID=7137 RepID=A0A6J1WH64_GALME|nr:lipase 3-like [Galleria mellonella]
MRRYLVLNPNIFNLIAIIDLIGICDTITINETYLPELLMDKLPILNSNTVPNFKTITKQNFQGLRNVNEDVHLNITQLLIKYNYPVEQHEVITSDGYIVTMFRIPSKGPPVFLMHGLLCSSDDFLTAGPDSGLAYLLSDAGYDVWLGNDRSNKHSKRHITLSPHNKEFWDFSFDEIGRYDLSAMIDYVLQITGRNNLQYIGHSQGTTTVFILCSERPEYNEKISVMIALAPSAWISHIRSPSYILLSAYTSILKELSQALGLYEILPRNLLLDTIIKISCGTPATAKMFCNNILFFLYGYDYAQINVTNLPVIYAHYPSGAAIKQLLHYLQEIQSGKFCQYDYGPKINLNKYGTIQPPDYPVERITTKVALMYSDNDLIATRTDIETLVRKLPNIVKFYRVPFKKFNHMDFLFAKDVKKLLYNRIVDLLYEYSQIENYKSFI